MAGFAKSFKPQRSNRQTRRSTLQSIKTQDWGEWSWARLGEIDCTDVPIPHGLLKAATNNIYSVQFFKWSCAWGVVDRLLIRRHDHKQIAKWGDLQRIKNELISCDRVALQIFPEQQHLVDEANLYHLWVLPEGTSLPIGYRHGR